MSCIDPHLNDQRQRCCGLIYYYMFRYTDPLGVVMKLHNYPHNTSVVAERDRMALLRDLGRRRQHVLARRSGGVVARAVVSEYRWLPQRPLTSRILLGAALTPTRFLPARHCNAFVARCHTFTLCLYDRVLQNSSSGRARHTH